MVDSLLRYRLADVFAERPYEGNGVAIFVDPGSLTTRALQTVTVEVKQFESAYLWPTEDPQVFDTRIFVLDRELGFAGHPLLGAAAVLHDRHQQPDVNGMSAAQLDWSLRLGSRVVGVQSRRIEDGAYTATMDQGRPVFGEVVTPEYRLRVAQALSLKPSDLRADLPMMWVSTGLKYLIVPVHDRALASARIAAADFGALLAEVGAELVYVLSPAGPEGRNWVNDGSVEDIATGSAAGPAAAYLVRWGVRSPADPIRIAQGRFLSRPSTMQVDIVGYGDDIQQVLLTGGVCMTGWGTLDQRPAL